MKNSILAVAVMLILIGCTDKKCEPQVEFMEQTFPVMETIDINTSIKIPSYSIERKDIRIFDGNVSMKIKTFKKIKDGDAKKIEYLKRRLRVFIYVYELLNGQVVKYNKEFVK